MKKEKKKIQYNAVLRTNQTDINLGLHLYCN